MVAFLSSVPATASCRPRARLLMNTTRCCSLLSADPERRNLKTAAAEVENGKKKPDCSSSSSALSSNNSNQFAWRPVYGRRKLTCVGLLYLALSLFSEGRGTLAAEVEDVRVSIVRNEVRRVMSKGKAASVLRLVFHDAGTYDMDEKSGGMNGSIIYELERPENSGLMKPVKLLEKAKIEIEKQFPISWADLISIAGAEAVSLCGGPSIPVQLGRVDAIVPDPEGRLPEESMGASSLKLSFSRIGLVTQELVALSGAHTIGGKGFGNPTAFDNAYFRVLLQKPWTSSDSVSKMIGLPSDHVLVEDDDCLRWIMIYANDEHKFFEDFKGAYLKLVKVGAQWQDT